MYLLSLRLNFYEVKINIGSHFSDGGTPLIVLTFVTFFINEVWID